MILPQIQKRQVIFLNDDDRLSHERLGWWYSPAAYIVKWTIVLSLFLLFFLWVTLGYVHARRRMRQGLKPMAYHRWLIPKSQREQHAQSVNAYYNPGSYTMNYGNQQTTGITEPPPVYSSSDMPPTYVPPPGSNKIAHEQGLPAYASRPVTMAAPPPSRQ